MPGPDAFLGEFYPTFKIEIVTISHKSFQNIEERTLPKSFCETGIKTRFKTTQEKYRPISS